MVGHDDRLTHHRYFDRLVASFKQKEESIQRLISSADECVRKREEAEEAMLQTGPILKRLVEESRDMKKARLAFLDFASFVY